MITEQTYKPGDKVEVHDQQDTWTPAHVIEGDDKRGYRVRYSASVDGVAFWELDRMRKAK